MHRTAGYTDALEGDKINKMKGKSVRGEKRKRGEKEAQGEKIEGEREKERV